MRRHGVFTAEGPVDVFEHELSATGFARQRHDTGALPGMGIFEPDRLGCD